MYEYGIWCMSLCVGDRLVFRYKPAYQTVRVTYTRYRIDTLGSPDNEHGVARNMYRIEINMYKQELYVKLVIKYN